MLVHLPEQAYYMRCLVLNSPGRYEEVLHCLLHLFLEAKPGNVEQKLIQHLKEMTSLVSDARQLVTLETITSTRKRILLDSLLAQEESPPDRIILPLFSEKDTAPVIDFIKNEVSFYRFLIS